MELLHKMTIKDVANHLGLSWDTVKDIHKNYLKHKFSHIDIKDVKHIGIDEFAVRKGHNYLTIVVDMVSGAIIHVGDGKGIESLKKFWPKLKRSGAKVESVSSDMSAAFISAIKKIFPTPFMFSTTSMFRNWLAKPWIKLEEKSITKKKT